MKRMFLLAAMIGIAVVIPQKASAQFATFDAANFATNVKNWVQDVQNGASLQSEVTNGIKMFNQAVQMYSLALQETQFLKKGQWMMAVGFGAQHAGIPGQPAWDTALTSVGGMANASNAFQQMMTPGMSIQNRIQLMNSFGASAIAAIGSCNVAAVHSDSSMSAVEQVMFNMNPAANTRANQANVGNMTLQQLARQQQCQNALAQKQLEIHLANMMQQQEIAQGSVTTFTKQNSVNTTNPMYNNNPAGTLLLTMN